MKANCEYVKFHYDVPAEIGRRVDTCKGQGIIAADRGHYIGVNLDCDKPGHIKNFHPADGITYLEMGNIRPMTRSQRNYSEYLRLEMNESFAEWMGFSKNRRSI